MEFKSISKKMNGISTLYSPLKRDPFWIRVLMCFKALYIFENQKNFQIF